MVQYRNAAHRNGTANGEKPDATPAPRDRKTPDWKTIVKLGGKYAEPKLHGPVSSDAYQSWAMPEHLREKN